MQPLIEGVDFYYNDEGFVVLTEKYHLEKGYCCGNGCLHCPYDYENVPGQKKAELIKARSLKDEEKRNNS
jgi:hypothetical protein